MKVFISWSGERSKYIAKVFFEWLPEVIQAIEPWMSTEMDKGVSWDKELSEALASHSIGLFCLTRDNLQSPYLHYEAGAISNLKGSSNISFLFDIKHSEVKTALNRFQNVLFERNDVFKILTTINKKLEEAGETFLTQEKLKKSFEKYWSDLESALTSTPELQIKEEKPIRPTEDILEEVLNTVRDIHTGLSLPIFNWGKDSTELKANNELLNLKKIELTAEIDRLRTELNLIKEKTKYAANQLEFPSQAVSSLPKKESRLGKMTNEEMAIAAVTIAAVMEKIKGEKKGKS